MRIVLDTNVLVSGLLNPAGAPGRLLDLIVTGEVELAVDDRILIEYDAVLRRPKSGFHARDVVALLDYIHSGAHHVQAPPLSVRLAHPADATFVEVAAAAGADSLVTGNARHFARAVSPTELRMESPADFVRRWRRARRPGRVRGSESAGV